MTMKSDDDTVYSEEELLKRLSHGQQRMEQVRQIIIGLYNMWHMPEVPPVNPLLHQHQNLFSDIFKEMYLNVLLEFILLTKTVPRVDELE